MPAADGSWHLAFHFKLAIVLLRSDRLRSDMRSSDKLRSDRVSSDRLRLD